MSICSLETCFLLFNIKSLKVIHIVELSSSLLILVAVCCIAISIVFIILSTASEHSGCFHLYANVKMML